MKSQDKYYGIKFNKNIPEIGKVNKYGKEVEIIFEGTAYIIVRKDDEIEKTEIENNYKLKKEGEYEIEFINQKNKVFNLKLRIRTFGIFWLFLAMIFTVLFMAYNNRSIPENIVSKFVNYINLAVLKFDDNDDLKNQYEFLVDFKNTSSDEIKLANTISAKSLTHKKIAPRTKWEFCNINKYQK